MLTATEKKMCDWIRRLAVEAMEQSVDGDSLTRAYRLQQTIDEIDEHIGSGGRKV